MSQDQRRMEIGRWTRRELNAYTYRLELDQEQLQAELTKEREANRLLIEEREQLQHRDRVVSRTNETLGRYVNEGKAEIERLRGICRYAENEYNGLHERFIASEAKVAEQDKEIQHRKKYEGFLKSCIACGESLETSEFGKFEYWLEKYLSIIK